MREIKYRAFIKDIGVMCPVGALYFGRNYDLEGVSCHIPNGYVCTKNVADVYLMQYTGLKDKNGVKIYENDLLKCTSKIYTNLGATRTGEYEETIKQVIWKDDGWGTRVISSNLTSKGAKKSGLVITTKYAEVIGDIYQNKDLLEG